MEKWICSWVFPWVQRSTEDFRTSLPGVVPGNAAAGHLKQFSVQAPSCCSSLRETQNLLHDVVHGFTGCMKKFQVIKELMKMLLKEPISLQDTSDKLIIASSEQWCLLWRQRWKTRWVAVISDMRWTEICMMLLEMWMTLQLWLQEL